MSYVKNTLYVGIAKLVENIISYLIIVMISRSLGASGLGQYSFIFSFVGLFFILSSFGFGPLTVQYASKHKNIDSFVSNVFALRFILNLISLVIFSIFVIFIKKDLIVALILAGVQNLIGSLNSISISILRSKNSGKIIGLIQIFERTIALIGAFITIFVFNSLELFILVLVVSSFFKFVLEFHFSSKYFKFSSVNFSKFVDLLKKGFPFFLIASFAIIYVKIDSVMLAFFYSDSVVGWYNAPYKLITILNVFPVLLLTFGFPAFSSLFNESKVKLKALFSTIIYYCNLIIFPIIVGVWFVGDRVLEFIYGFGSYESFIAFRILIIAQLFVFLTTIMGQLIAAAGKQKVFAWIGGIGALVNVVLNLVLIPSYSLYGAGVATLVTYFLMFILMWIYIRKNFFKFRIRVPLISTLIMGMVLVNILHLHLVWIVLVCGGIYGLIFLILKINSIKNNFKK